VWVPSLFAPGHVERTSRVNCQHLVTFADRQKVAMSADRLHTYLMPTSQRILRAIVDERRRLLARELHAEAPRRQTEACRPQAIVHAAGDEFETMRETLLESAAQIDHGVAGVGK
jgi:hypothetical protein